VRKCLASIHVHIHIHVHVLGHVHVHFHMVYPPTSGASCLHLLRKVRENETVSSHFMARTCCVAPSLPLWFFIGFFFWLSHCLFYQSFVVAIYLFLILHSKREQTRIRLMDKLCKALEEYIHIYEYILFDLFIQKGGKLFGAVQTRTFYIGKFGRFLSTDSIVCCFGHGTSGQPN